MFEASFDRNDNKDNNAEIGICEASFYDEGSKKLYEISFTYDKVMIEQRKQDEESKATLVECLSNEKTGRDGDTLIAVFCFQLISVD